MSRRLFIAAAALFAVAIVATLGAVWWWALLGMAQEVRAAVTVTVGMVWLVALIAWLTGGLMEGNQ